MSDNGEQFTSYSFKKFLTDNGILNKTTAPFHPATNGHAERSVQTVKKALYAMQDEQGEPHVKLCRLLVQLRRTPNSSGKSAYELMFSRPIRTSLTRMLERKTRHEEPLERDMPSRNFIIGDAVQARDYSPRGEKWQFGNVIKKDGRLHYMLKMENGNIWRRHVDQLLPTNFRGEN